MTLPASPVGVGVLGCGSVLFGPYRPEIRDLAAAGRARLVVACDIRPDVEDAVRADFDVERFTTRPEEVLGAADVDVVLVLTPPASHAALATAALGAGKHVLVEKPVALDLASARRAVAAAQAANRRLVCAPFVTLSATHRQIAELLAAGTIGRILSVRAVAGTAGPSWGRWFYEGPGGGPLFDLGVYSLTAIVNLVGPVRRVTAVSGIAVPERVVDGGPMRPTIDDNFQVALDFGGGILGVLSTGFTMASLRTPAFELFGSEGTVQMLGADWEPAGSTCGVERHRGLGARAGGRPGSGTDAAGLEAPRRAPGRGCPPRDPARARAPRPRGDAASEARPTGWRGSSPPPSRRPSQRPQGRRGDLR